MDDFFSSTGFESGGIFNLTPRQAFFLCGKGAVLIDVREACMSHFKMFDVPLTINCPFSLLEETFHNLPWEKPMIFADSAGIHSKEAVQFIIGKGQGRNIANLAGGLIEWERDEMPIKVDNKEQLSGSCMCQLRPRNRKE